jgi:hypothetical protein|tara:strand:+ start:554 stop:943 length:390 start_codon:yes stop_codon:yes gene_type:complete
MKHTLTFKSNKSLVRLARDTKALNNFKIAYCDKYTSEKCFYLVKDNGIYLMNCYSDNPYKELGRDAPNSVVYASGFNPKFNKDIWEKTHRVSGDDFAENIYLSDDQLERVVNGGTITIKLSKTEIEVIA